MSNEKLRGKDLLDREERMASYDGRDKIVSSHELAEELKQTSETTFTIATGVKSLDRILGGGVEAGDLIVVTGPTGEGKTTLLMSITKNMAEAGINSVWFTLEVTPRQFLQKILRAVDDDETKLPLFYLPHAGVEEAEDKYVKEWEQRHRRKYETIDWIEDKIIEAKVKVENSERLLKAVFIDHIHMIYSLARSQSSNQSMEIGDMVSRIKNLALSQNLAIFLIAHSKDPSDSQNREPRKEDIRDSGLISRVADDVIGVWRIANSNDGTNKNRDAINEDDNKAKIRVFKNRSHGTMGFFTAYHKNHYLTEDLDWDEEIEKANKKVEAIEVKNPKGRKDHGSDW